MILQPPRQFVHDEVAWNDRIVSQAGIQLE